ncbi:putative Outer membrane protein, OMP85 family [Gammaproteobacteria bacterium]
MKTILKNLAPLLLTLPATGTWPAEIWEQRAAGQRLPAPEYAQPAPAWPGHNEPQPAREAPLSTLERVVVERFELTGNRAFSASELASVTAPYTHRAITAEELQEVRRRLTLYYTERGYLNSGAVIPDQPVQEGVVRIRIIEGRLARVEVTGNTHLRADYVQDRLRPAEDTPLNIQDLQDRLQRLQQNPLVEQLHATLAPGVEPGEGIMQLEVREARPYEVGLAVANNNPPSVGATRAHLYGFDRNLTGAGDTLALSYGHSLESTTDDWRVSYARPLSARDRTIQAWAEQNKTSVIENRFDRLDILSHLESYGVSLTEPVYQTLQQNLTLGANLEWRHSKSTLLGYPFSFAPGEVNGEATVAVARFSQEWLDRRLDQVIAARSTISAGLDAGNATIHSGGPDSRFWAWLGQFQWAKRFGARDYQVIFKANGQWASDSLLSMEKCALGGIDTVRGYPGNTLVRDQCFNTSLEFRVPVYELALAGGRPNEGQVQLAAFADYGWAQNKGRFALDPEVLASVGIGARWDPNAKIHAALYWGYPLREVEKSDERSVGSRINFAVQVAY